MTDVTPPTGTEPAAAAAQATDASQDRTVPYDRFQQVNEAAKTAKAQLEEMKTRLEELESRDQSELERERKAREKYESGFNEMQQKLTVVERSSWLRSAAAEAGFDDPEDAVAFISPSSVESVEQAEREVKKLAKRKPKLLRETSPAPPIGQVLANGQRVDPNAQQRDEHAEQFAAQIRAAQDTDGWQSIPLS